MNLKAFYCLTSDNTFDISDSFLKGNNELNTIIDQVVNGSVVLMGRNTYKKCFNNKNRYGKTVKCVLRSKEKDVLKDQKWTLFYFDSFSNFEEKFDSYEGDVWVIGGANTIERVYKEMNYEEVHIVILQNCLSGNEKIKLNFVPRGYILKDLFIKSSLSHLILTKN